MLLSLSLLLPPQPLRCSAINWGGDDGLIQLSSADPAGPSGSIVSGGGSQKHPQGSGVPRRDWIPPSGG